MCLCKGYFDDRAARAATLIYRSRSFALSSMSIYAMGVENGLCLNSGQFLIFDKTFFFFHIPIVFDRHYYHISFVRAIEIRSFELVKNLFPRTGRSYSTVELSYSDAKLRKQEAIRY